MKPTLGLAGLNTLRSVIALVSGALSAGITLFGRQVQDGSSLVDCTLLSVLWLYVGITAVPWANLRGMKGATPALPMTAWAAYLAAATAFTGWSTAVHPALREQRPRAPEGHCVTVVAPAPVAREAPRRPAVVARPTVAPTPAPTTPAVVPASPVAEADAPERPRRRHHRRSEGGAERQPSVWLERDPVSTAPAGR